MAAAGAHVCRWHQVGVASGCSRYRSNSASFSSVSQASSAPSLSAMSTPSPVMCFDFGAPPRTVAPLASVWVKLALKPAGRQPERITLEVPKAASSRFTRATSSVAFFLISSVSSPGAASFACCPRYSSTLITSARSGRRSTRRRSRPGRSASPRRCRRPVRSSARQRCTRRSGARATPTTAGQAPPGARQRSRPWNHSVQRISAARAL
jgi:hypothetical protein